MASAPQSRINSLQAGRAIAALMVVAHHSALAARTRDQPFPGAAILDAGYLGVDFFFVLSGFIIYHSTVGSAKSASAYAIGRMRRIYIPYLPVGLAAAAVYTLLPGISQGTYAWGWFTTLTLAPVAPHPALSVAWTLQHEILFYSLFGLLYFTRTLLAGLVLWALCIAIASALRLPPTILLAPINLEFLMGVAVAAAYRKGWGFPAFYLAAPVPLIAWFLLGAERQHSVLVGLALALAVLPTVALEARGKLEVPVRLVLLGAASYSIYLVHNPMISVLARLAPQHWAVILPLGFLVSVAAGLAYFRAIERPLLTAPLHTARRRPSPAVR